MHHIALARHACRLYISMLHHGIVKLSLDPSLAGAGVAFAIDTGLRCYIDLAGVNEINRGGRFAVVDRKNLVVVLAGWVEPADSPIDIQKCLRLAFASCLSCAGSIDLNRLTGNHVDYAICGGRLTVGFNRKGRESGPFTAPFNAGAPGGRLNVAVAFRDSYRE